MSFRCDTAVVGPRGHVLMLIAAHRIQQGRVARAPGLHPSPVIVRRRCARWVSLIGRRHIDPLPERARAPSRLPASRCVMVAIESSVFGVAALGNPCPRTRGGHAGETKGVRGGAAPVCSLPQQMPFLSDSVHALRDPGRVAA